MQIAKYTVAVDYQINQSSMRKVDKSLKNLEAKLRKFGKNGLAKVTFDVSKFNVDQHKLNIALGAALDRASNTLVFDISHFEVDQHHLNQTISVAMARAMLAAPNNINLNAHMRGLPAHGVRERAIAGRHVAAGGAFAGVASRFYGPAIALAAGGYGIGALNQRNQQVVSAQLQTNAVVQQAQGANYNPQNGPAAFEWLRSQSNRIGFNYLEAAPDYNKLISGLTGAGMTVEQSQGVFKGFSELSRVNKLDRVAQQRVFRALSQIAGKGKLQAEELTQQLAESLPGATSLFARAYQQQTGGNLTGKEAIAKLMEDMKKGKVKSDILTFAGSLASQQAAPGLSAASKASQAEQARFQNVTSDMAIVASQNGVEEGFARIFRTLSTGLSENTPMVKALANAFNETTKEAEKLLLFPQSFARALEGRDSLVADWLGKDTTRQLKEDWQDIKALFDSIMGMQTPEWLPTLQSTAKEIAAIMNQIAEFQRWRSETAPAARQIIEDEYNQGAGGLWANVKGIAKANLFTFKSVIGMGDDDPTANYWMQREQSQGYDTAAMYGNDPKAWRDNAKARNEAAAKEVLGGNGYGISQPVQQNNDIKIDISVQAENTEGMENWFKTSFQKTLEEALPSFTQKE